MLYIVESKKPLGRLIGDLETAVSRNAFGVIGVHDLRDAIVKKGVPFAHDCLIYDVCNPHHAKQVLDANIEISTALPCRISVYEQGGMTKLATIRPTMLIGMYRNEELRAVAEEAEATLIRIMNEAATC
ncbi:MAG: DUF302 domain-containing protein [Planctomycetes bacterium]|nr:DUF302 domain-containing protein [Planctomycetota bacterium]MBI3848454.1 DUF302 domain-containing protein [Planctomycetota bacterium]